MIKREKWDVVRDIDKALNLFQRNYCDYIEEENRGDNGAMYRAMTHGDRDIVGYLNRAIKRMKESIDNPEVIPDYSDADLLERFYNAWTTHCQAGGHGKAAHNESAAGHWAERLKSRGLKVPEGKERYNKGIFNGPGAV